MAMFASTRTGALGFALSSLKIFQDFFVDLELPVTITQGDRISIPVAIYNYTDRAGNVQLKLQPEAGQTLNIHFRLREISNSSQGPRLARLRMLRSRGWRDGPPGDL